jgi:hypothetical protein
MPGFADVSNFIVRYEEWSARDSPSPEAEVAVLAWIYGLQSRPYASAVRALDIGVDFWFARVMSDETDTVVCLYQVDEANDSAICSAFATLRNPV